MKLITSVAAIAGVIRAGLADPGHALNKRDAAVFLLRTTRSNSGLLEELRDGDIQRECVEEACDKQEVLEALKSEDSAESFWSTQTKQCGYEGHPSPCNTKNTQKCINGWGDYKCLCMEGFYGKNCENAHGVQATVETTNVIIPSQIVQSVNVTIDAVKFVSEPDPEPMTEAPETVAMVVTEPHTDGTTTEAATITTSKPAPRYTAKQMAEINRNKAEIQQQLDRMAPIPGLLDMMAVHADANTKATIEDLKRKFEEIRARLLALYNDEDALLADTTQAVAAMNNLLNTIMTTTQPAPAPRQANYTIDCGADYMTVQFSQHWLDSHQLNGEQVKIPSNGRVGCESKVFSAGSKMSIALDNRCLVKTQSTEDALLYKFDILVAPYKEATVVIDWGSHWAATCSYNRYDTTSTRNKKGEVVPVLEFPKLIDSETGAEDTYDGGKENSVGEFNVRMDVAHSDSYTALYKPGDYPLGIDMGNRINAQISFVNASMSKHLFMIAEKCWGTPKEGDTMQKIFLLSSRCPSNTLAEIENRPAANIDRFSAKVFKFPGAANAFLYITCRVRICQEAGDCQRSCGSSIIKRKRRSLAGNARATRARTYLKEVRAPGGFFERAEATTAKATGYEPIAMVVLVAIMLSFLVVSVISIRRDNAQRAPEPKGPVEAVAASNPAFTGEGMETTEIH